MGFSRQEYQSGLPFPSPVDHDLSELSTMTCPSWVALHSMAHSFTELDKAVVYVVRLVHVLSSPAGMGVLEGQPHAHCCIFHAFGHHRYSINIC